MDDFSLLSSGPPPLESMASSNVAINGLYDVAFKPKLLRSLLRDFVPDEKLSFTNPSDLAHVINAVKTHGLLSERAVDQNVISSWKSAVDDWINRLTELTISIVPDKVWAAICLLGLTCQECNSERFLTSYRQWFDSIITHIQTLSDSHLVRVASFASMSDLLTRLSGFPSEKKDGTSLAAKVVLPVLKLLNEDASDFELEEAVCLLCKLINVFPSSVSQHYDNVEASIFSRFMSENGSINLLKKLGHCMVMLPKSRGVHSWSLMMQKVILFLNSQLTLAFQGLEEEKDGNEVVRLLVPPGKDPPPPLGGFTESRRYLDLSIKRPEKVLVSRVSILMSCCGMMLSNSFPVQIPVPAHPLIALTKRMLMMDGSLSPSSHSMTIARHEFICSELPTLHVCSLDLLSAIVKRLRSQLLPHVAGITRMLTDYIGTCSLPEPRIKVYSVLRVMLLSMGIGNAIHLFEIVINNALADLDSSVHENNGTYHAPLSEVSEEGIHQPSNKKRKHAASTGLLEEETSAGGLAMERTQQLAPISVRIAALKVLETLLTVAGALRSDGWRSKVDHLLIAVASDTCKGGFTDDRDIGETTSTWQDLQLAALRALLASLLSPGCARPPHLDQSLELFRKGTLESGTNIAEYCQHALLALEVLMHPRAHSLVDFQAFADDCDGASIKFSEIHSNNPGNNTSSLIGAQEKQPSQTRDDELFEGWIGNVETDIGFGNISRTDEEPSRITDNWPVSELFPAVNPSVWQPVSELFPAINSSVWPLVDMAGSQFDSYDKIAEGLSVAFSNADKSTAPANAEKGKGVALDFDDDIQDIVYVDSDSE